MPTLSAAERAYVYTKDAILRGDFAAGSVISEGLVCDAIEVSRTPVHEAFLRLATEELLSLESRKGAVVRPMSPGEAEDVLQMREAIEAAAAQRVVQDDLVDDVLPRLRVILAEQERAERASDVEAFLPTDDAFHAAVIEGSRNRIAVQFMAVLRDRQSRLRYQYLRVSPSHLASALAQHRALADALERRDADAYRTILREHVASHRGAL